MVPTKYVWFGASYTSNICYKFITNYATFDFETVGNLSFKDTDDVVPVVMSAMGDTEDGRHQ